MKQIEEFPNYYIDEMGIVYDKNRVPLTQNSKSGYPRVWLYNIELRTAKNPKGRKAKTVRNLVAETFLDIPPYLKHLPPTRIVVKSKNGRSADNRLSNLQYEDSKYHNFPYCNTCYRFHKESGPCLL